MVEKLFALLKFEFPKGLPFTLSTAADRQQTVVADTSSDLSRDDINNARPATTPGPDHTAALFDTQQ